ncbi:peptidase S8/S53 domain-containing protein [Xylaria palmicola]|nr:peptidase S8/S53 domain-containing protein [Xylaria palmicola]
MGWSSTEGLGDRRKFPMLEKVNIVVKDGLEDTDRRKANAETCKRKIIQHGGPGPRERDIDVKIRYSNTSGFSSHSTVGGIGFTDDAHPWLKGVQDFASFLRNASKEKQVEPVKIAIIDDGIDATVPIFERRIANGATFCLYPDSPEFVNSYYVPSGKHGTLMAQLICNMCPNVQLYVARLQELPTLTGGSGRRVTAESAAKAVEWAVSCDVNIISMSWTIQTNDADSPDMKKFEKAINIAHQKGILMFCSASDQGGHTIDSSYPGKWGQCTRIGGATFEGDKLTWVDQAVDFWLPGRDVPFTSGDGKSTTYESGSSVATAAASGLAAVLLYSARLLSAGWFQDRTALQNAFSNMSTGRDGKFPRAGTWFRNNLRREIKKAQEQNQTDGKKMSRNIDVESLEWDVVSQLALSNLLDLIRRDMS